MAEPAPTTAPNAAPEPDLPALDGIHVERRTLPSTIYDTSLAVGNEAIVQSANLYLVARRVLLTSLGAVALTIEETNEFFERLVERGELAEAELTRIVSEYIERSRRREHETMEMRRATVDKAAVALADSVEVILGRLNVPTRSDIEELSHKISQLNDKVMQLQAQRARMAALPAPAPGADMEPLQVNSSAR